MATASATNFLNALRRTYTARAAPERSEVRLDTGDGVLGRMVVREVQSLRCRQEH
jgi:hypothetical protein